VASYREYETLVERCGGWSVEDLGDLLHEIDRDRDLQEVERSSLQARLYRLIWDRAQPRLREARAQQEPNGSPAADDARPGAPAADDDGTRR
jgi:hypothetical protein